MAKQKTNAKKKQTRHVPQAELVKPCSSQWQMENKYTRKHWVVKGNHFRGKEPIPNQVPNLNKPKH